MWAIRHHVNVSYAYLFMCECVCVRVYYYCGLDDCKFFLFHKWRGVYEEIALHELRSGVGLCARAGRCSCAHRPASEYRHCVTLRRLHAAV